MDTDPKSIHQLEFVGKLKKLVNDGNATDAGNGQKMFVLTILEEIKETKLKLSLKEVYHFNGRWQFMKKQELN